MRQAKHSVLAEALIRAEESNRALRSALASSVEVMNMRTKIMFSLAKAVSTRDPYAINTENEPLCGYCHSCQGSPHLPNCIFLFAERFLEEYKNKEPFAIPENFKRN